MIYIHYWRFQPPPEYSDAIASGAVEVDMLFVLKEKLNDQALTISKLEKQMKVQNAEIRFLKSRIQSQQQSEFQRRETKDGLAPLFICGFILFMFIIGFGKYLKNKQDV